MVERIKLGASEKERINIVEADERLYSLPIEPQPAMPEDGEFHRNPPYPIDHDPDGYNEGWEDVYHLYGCSTFMDSS